MENDAIEPRKALCRFETEGIAGAPPEGEGEARITDDGLSIGPVAVEFLDADAYTDQDRVLTLGLHPQGTLRLFHLARRHETFARTLGEARDRARLGGMLAHGITAPERFDGCLRVPEGAIPSRLLVYATHLAVVPDGSDPFQLPFGSFSSIGFDEPEWNVHVATDSGTFVFGQLARKTEAFTRALTKAWEAQEKRLAEASGTSLFADGRGVPATSLPEFDRLMHAFCAPERVEGAGTIVGLAGRENVRLGLVELLDPDAEGLAAAHPLPRNVAAFLLAQVGELAVLEVLSGPKAATYVFRGPVAGVGRDLAELHFRRGPLALTPAEVTSEAARPYRLALRRLDPLVRLREATVARVIHTEGWETGIRKALGNAG